MTPRRDEGLNVTDRLEDSADTDEVAAAPNGHALAAHSSPDRGRNGSGGAGPLAKPAHMPRADQRHPHRASRSWPPVYGALDLGTNNCRLLVARPSRRGFQVVDAFSRIIRLGEGVSQTGRLSDAAIERTLDALRVCSDKLARRNVQRSRLIATEACRIAANGDEFIRRVQRETGLKLEIVSRETEALLAVAGCSTLLDPGCDWALVFDIGGGSTELIWVDLRKLGGGSKRQKRRDRTRIQNAIAGWTSLPVGVVTLSERFGGRAVDDLIFEAMVKDVMDKLAPFDKEHGFSGRLPLERAHLLGTSGTVTTIAGVHLNLASYVRSRVDGAWMSEGEVRRVSRNLLGLSYDQRTLQPCIGPERADLVLGGCAILEGIMRLWPCQRLRVADRGLREGILISLMAEDQRKRSAWRKSG